MRCTRSRVRPKRLCPSCLLTRPSVRVLCGSKQALSSRRGHAPGCVWVVLLCMWLGASINAVMASDGDAALRKLQGQLEEREQHVNVMEHMNPVNRSPMRDPATGQPSDYLLLLSPPTKTLRGNCANDQQVPVGYEHLEPTKLQCILISDLPMIGVTPGDNASWQVLITRLYLYLWSTSTEETSAVRVLSAAHVFIEFSVMHGTRMQPAHSLLQIHDDAKLYMRNSSVSIELFDASRTTAADKEANGVVHLGNAKSTIFFCSFDAESSSLYLSTPATSTYLYDTSILDAGSSGADFVSIASGPTDNNERYVVYYQFAELEGVTLDQGIETVALHNASEVDLEQFFEADFLVKDFKGDLIFTEAMAPEYAEVEVVDELQVASKEGAHHIMVKNHIDLSDISDIPGFITIQKPTRSVQGNCGAVGPAPRHARETAPAPQPQQCVIFTFTTAVQFIAEDDGNGWAMWVSRLYVKTRRPAKRLDGIPGEWVLLTVHLGVRLYMDHVTLHGPQAGTESFFILLAVGVVGNLYMEDCNVTDMSARETAVGVFSVAGSQVSLERCHFDRLNVDGENETACSPYTCAMAVALEPSFGEEFSSMRLTASTFSNVGGSWVQYLESMYASNMPDVNATLYTDIDDLYQFGDASMTQVGLQVRPLAEADGMGFLSAEDADLAAIKENATQVWSSPLPGTNTSPEPSQDTDLPQGSLRSIPAWATAAASLGAATVAAAVAVTAFWLYRRRHDALAAASKVTDIIAPCESFDVFLTHEWNGKDKRNHARVQRVCRSLQRLGVTPWFDEERMEGDVQDCMMQGLKHSSGVLVFLTERYQEKVTGNKVDNCKFEFDIAMAYNWINMTVAVMEEGMLNPHAWEGKLRGLGTRLYTSLVDMDELSEEELDERVRTQLLPCMTWLSMDGNTA